MSKKSPYLTSLIAWLTFSLASFLILQYNLDLPYYLNLIIAINMGTFLLFGFDKLQARNKGRRVPERILYLATFLGGAVGTLTGMHLFKHKTSKTSFQLVVWILILLDVALIAYFLS